MSHGVEHEHIIDGVWCLIIDLIDAALEASMIHEISYVIPHFIPKMR